MSMDLALGGANGTDEYSRRWVLLPNLDEGHALLAYGGEDGSVSCIDDSEPKARIARRFDEIVRAIAASHDGKRVAVGFDDGTTTIFAYSDAAPPSTHPFLVDLSKDSTEEDVFSQLDGIRSKHEDSFAGPRFSAPIRHLVFDPRSYHLAVASEAGVCVVDAASRKTISEKGRFLQEAAEREHDASGIRGVAYGRKQGDETFLATLGMDGRMCVWDVTSNDPELGYELLHRDTLKCVHKPDIGVMHGADAMDQSSLPLFGKHFLALPGNSDVQLRRIADPSQQIFVSSIGQGGHIDQIVCMAFSKEKWLVTSGRDGRLVLWKLNDNKSSNDHGTFLREVARYDKSPPTSLLWIESKLFVAFANGTFLVLPETELFPKEREEAPKKTREKRAVTEENARSTRLTKKQKHTSVDDDSDDEDLFVTANNNAPTQASFVDDEADEDDAADNIVKNATTPLNDTTDFAIDYQDDPPMPNDDLDDMSLPVQRVTGTADMMPKPQPAFAPSSTPLDLPRRIMCWNHIGTITIIRGDDGTVNNTVDIGFVDSAFRRPISFTDNMDFIVGSLGEDGGIFATDTAEDDDDQVEEIADGLQISDRMKAVLKRSQRKDVGRTGSNVYFHRFETFASMRDKDWYLTLPDGERALGCACGEGWAACITSRRFLRLFSLGGNQDRVVWLAGEPVTMVGRFRFVAVFYHEASPLLDATQKLGFLLYDAVSMREITSGSVASIGSGSSLGWAGFGNDGALMVMDSDGMVSMLVASDDRPSWVPVLDTVGHCKSSNDSFWPVTVHDGKLICVPLKGGVKYPDAARRPVTTSLGFRMPFARGALESSSTVLEELSVRANLALSQKRFMQHLAEDDGEDVSQLEDEYDGLCAQVDKVTLKLFMAVMEASKLERALDLVNRLHLEKSYDIALTIADRMNHRNLSDRIEAERDRRFAVDTEENVETTDESTVVDASSSRVSPVAVEKELVPKAPPVTTRVRNPFAKRRVDSPPRARSEPPNNTSPNKRVSLSRTSTFSGHARQRSKLSKKII